MMRGWMRARWWCVTLAGCSFHGVTAAAIGDGPTADAIAIDAAIDGGPPIPILYVQGTGADVDSDTLSIDYVSAQVVHDLDLVVVAWTDTTIVQAAVSDSNGNMYTQVGALVTASGFSQEVFVAANIKAGTNTVTATLPNSTGLVLRIVEYSGLLTASPVDTAVSMSGLGATVGSGPLTSHHAHELMFAANTVAGTIIAHPPELTQRLLVMGNSVEDREVTAIGSYDATATQDNSGDFVMTLVGLIGAR